MANSSQKQEGDALFEFLTGGIPKESYNQQIYGMREGRIPNPTPYNPADFSQGEYRARAILNANVPNATTGY